MFNRAYNFDNRYRAHKLSVGKGSLKLRLQHSKRNNSKTKNKLNNLSINNDKNIHNTKINVNNSLINKNISKDNSKDNNNYKSINQRSKVLSITSNTNEIINNYLTNDTNNNNEINISNNENMNNSYIHITLNSNNPFLNHNVINITEEKEKENEKEKEKEKEIEREKEKEKESIKNQNIGFGDIKYNIIVNKKHQNNDNNSSIKEKIINREHNKNRIKKKTRDLSAKPRENNLNFNKKIYLKEKYDSNYNTKKKNYSPLIESNEPNQNSRKKTSSIIYNSSIPQNLHYSSHNNSQKVKNNISSINTISFSNNNISNFNNNNNNNNSNINNHNHNHNYMNTNPNDEEYFEYNNDKNQELTKDEKMIYGDRIMKGYIKKKLLGKGGCGIVWLCTKAHENNNNYKQNNLSYDNANNNFNENIEYAVKQTSKKNGNALLNSANENIITAKNEIKVLSTLNNNENNSFIPKIYEYYEDNNDLWFSFEKGGISLSGLCFKIKGEFEKGERIYLIQKGKFLISLFSSISQFKYLLKSLLSAINYINKKGIIHSDIKTENILIEYNDNDNSNENLFKIKSIKIIDFGSSFFINNTSSISSNTPEYLCPEITIGNKKFIKELKNSNLKYINCIDIWSLGITILELCLCCPSWMSYKAKVIINGKIYHPNGLFGCRGRDSSKIYQKQIELTKNINKKLKNSMLYLFEQNDRKNFIDLIKKMLELDYKKRITCQDAINHPFFNE